MELSSRTVFHKEKNRDVQGASSPVLSGSHERISTKTTSRQQLADGLFRAKPVSYLESELSIPLKSQATCLFRLKLGQPDRQYTVLECRLSVLRSRQSPGVVAPCIKSPFASLVGGNRWFLPLCLWRLFRLFQPTRPGWSGRCHQPKHRYRRE